MPISRRRPAHLCAAVLALAILHGTAASPGLALIQTSELKEWLSYIASDELEGRGNYSAGLGLAAAYIQDHLRAWNIRPAGDGQSYLQTVRVRSVEATSHSTVTVRAGRDTRTFKDGEGVRFARDAGGRRRLTLDRVEFAGYGLDADLRGKDVSGAAVIWLGADGPGTFDAGRLRRVLTGRSRHATGDLGAAATIAPDEASDGSATTTGRAAADFVTAERLDRPVPPAITVDAAFLTFLFQTAPVPYAELRRRASARSALPSFRLPDVTITINVDVDYEVVRTQLTHNVVAIVDGSDPLLEDTYVAFGAHYDHLGYAEPEAAPGGARPAPLYGRVSGDGDAADRIWNGADDDGSGTVAMMALARAFAEGPRPRRSLLFVWHAGEELGTFGSRYFTSYSTVPIDRIVAQLNIDMIGRNRDDQTSESNTVYLVGSDRISSELHTINREANQALDRPMTLDYGMNDPNDPEQIYYRSDHYSYAVTGIPVIFFTTGLHPDYHANTDDVSRILFDKMNRVVQLVYETGLRVANLDHAPVRDRQGPRTVN